MTAPFVLSIQSEVVYGHVGQGAARFALQRLGFDVLALPTVLLSNHPGHGRPTGDVIASTTLNALVDGLAARDLLKRTMAIMSGYLGEAGHAKVVADAVRRVKSANPNAIYVCDPVFGDEGGAYARPGVAEAIARELVPISDIVTPNRFELSSLTARRIHDPATALAAGQFLGRPEALLTSIPFGTGQIGAVVRANNASWAGVGERFEGVPNGTGDLMTALYLGWRLKSCPPEQALGRALSAVHHLARIAGAERMAELPLIEEQGHLASDTTWPIAAMPSV